jgi:PAS domain S-box-containing protein
MAQQSFEKFNLQRRLLVAVVVPLALLALLAALFLALSAYLRATTAWVEHSDRVLTSAQRLETLLIDRETGMRGYMLTNDPQFLGPYQQASVAITPMFDALGRLVADNPAQVQRLSALRTLAAQWHETSRAALALHNNGDLDQLAATHRDAKRRMDRIRQQLQLFTAMAIDLRDRRIQDVGRATRLVVFSSIVMSLLLGGVLGMVTWRQIRLVIRHYGQVLAAVQTHADALRESAARFQALFDRAPLGIALLRDQRTLMVNPAFASMFGYPQPAAAVGRRWADLFAPPTNDRQHAFFSLLAHEQSSLAFAEMAGVQQDGSTIPVHIQLAEINLPDGPAMVAYLTDQTMHQQLEGQMRQMQKLESIGRLASGIAHDFNNLLTALGSYIDLAQASLPAAHPAYADLDSARDVLARAASLTRQLLAFARKQPISPEIVNLNDIIERGGSLLQRLLGGNIEIRVVAAPDLGLVQADAGQIEQVLINLAVNARDAMPNGGRLTIETTNVTLDTGYTNEHFQVVAGEYIMLAVSDTGIGIPPEIQGQLFEPFFTTKGHAGGTGLGLATSYGIATQHGGYIWVYSEVGHGTTFKVYLPRLAPGTPKAARSEPADRGGTEVLLLVEDDPAVLALAGRALREAGYTVYEAAAGDAAIELAEAHAGAIDLLLVDVVLPQLSGIELAARLTARRPGLKTLFISGYGDQALLHQRRLPLGSAILPKPFAAVALRRAVRLLLDTTDDSQAAAREAP